MRVPPKGIITGYLDLLSKTLQEPAHLYPLKEKKLIPEVWDMGNGLILLQNVDSC